MKFKISTAKLNSILSRVGKGVGDSKVLPITHYVKINLSDDGLTVTATDSVNFITYKDKEVKGTAGEVVVVADTLIKLAAKTTKADMTFEVKGEHLEVKGNGKYTLPVNSEDKFPEYEFNPQSEGSVVETKTLRKVFKINKAAIATEMIMPCLVGYNVGDNVTTTDGVKMCINDIEVFAESRVLIPQPLADLLDTLSAEKVTIERDNDKLLFSTENIDIFGVELEGMDEFPDIAPLAEMEHPSIVTVNRAQLIEVLDRMSIFVDKFDNYGVVLGFGAEGVTVHDIKKNSSETIEYKTSENVEELELLVSIIHLQQLLAVLSKDVVTIGYGDGLPVKLSEEGIVQLLATVEDTEAAEIGEEVEAEEE